jgi:dienelactone hydrolase
MTAPAPVTIYLEGPHEPACAVFHAPAPPARPTAVIMCPPFGWDEVCSYRSRRYWAERLADAGYATIRLSYPGTGDSGGMPRDPGRLDAWTAAVSSAGAWLREASGASRIVAVALGLGGLLAYRAMAFGAPIDDLVLWATPARGRALVRQLRAFSKLEVSRFFEGLELPPPLPDGELEAGGFLLSAETIADLEALDVAARPLPNPRSRRVLLLERDGIAVDAKLTEALDRHEVKFTVAPGAGYAAMTSHPQQAVPPLEVIDRVTGWLDETSAPPPEHAGRPPALPAGTARSAVIDIGGGVRVQESPFVVEQPFGTISGILTEPLGHRNDGLCAVFLNAGAVRRVGPGRMWVEAARRWAARGVPTLRLDVEGIGDADGAVSPYADDGALYVPELVPQVLAALDLLEHRGIGQRFVLAGLCSGAYWSFHAALQDTRVVAALMVNAQAVIWDPGLGPARDFRRLLSPASWRKIRAQASMARVRPLVRWLLAAPIRWAMRFTGRGPARSGATDEVDDALDRLHASGTRTLMLFSAHEPLDDEFLRSGRMARLEAWDNVRIERIQVRDHTLRPNWAQAQAHASLDRALARELVISVTA